MNTALIVVLAFWPLWVGLAVAYVAARIDAHQDATWDDAPTRPGGLG